MSYLQNFKYEISGPSSEHKLVFLHGVMGSGANWRRVVPHFQNSYQVLTFDQRGHGWSFKPATGYAPEDYSLDLRLILDELNWNKVSLIGHSMGGRNALHFAQKYPQRLEALVIEDIGPQGQLEVMEKTIRMVEMVPVPFASKFEAKQYFEGEFTRALMSTSTVGGRSLEQARILAQYFYTNIESRADSSADWRFSKNAIISSLRQGHFQPRWDAVRDLTIPTLFIRGEHSEDFPKDEFAKVLALKNPFIRGAEVPNAGHWVHFDNPAGFITAVSEFLTFTLRADKT